MNDKWFFHPVAMCLATVGLGIFALGVLGSIWQVDFVGRFAVMFVCLTVGVYVLAVLYDILDALLTLAHRPSVVIDPGPPRV